MNLQVERILEQLSATFTVRDIMIEALHLVRAGDQLEAQKLLSIHPKFDIIPLPTTGPITSYFRRDKSRVEAIRTTDLISDGTSLLDLPQLLKEREFFFILSSNIISGFVHFSDLNKGPTKLPFFVLFEAVEQYIWPTVDSRLTESDLSAVLDQQRIENLKQRMERARKKEADSGWTGMLSFDEILGFSMYYEVIQLSNSDRELLANIRNRVAHSDRLLVEEHKDTRKLVKCLEICQKLLAEETG